MPAYMLYDAQYGRRFRELVDEGRALAEANGHEIPDLKEWNYGTKLGEYQGVCTKCGLMVFISMEEDRQYGGASVHKCPGRPFL